MKAIRLDIQNAMAIEAAEIVLGDGLTVVGGENGAGKTSLLIGPRIALFGKRVFKGDPIREGADRARVKVVLGDRNGAQYTVTRTVVARKGGQRDWRLEVLDANGRICKTPQALVNTLTGGQTVDPYGFVRLRPGEQVDKLEGVMGLDFTELDAKREELYAERVIVGRDLRAGKAAYERMPRHPDVSTREVSVSALAEKLQEANRINAHVVELEADVQQAMNGAQTISAMFEAEKGEVERELARLEELADRLKAELEAVQRSQAEVSETWQARGVYLDNEWQAALQKHRELQAAAAKAASDWKDTAPIQQQIAAAEDTNAKVRQNVEAAKMAEAIETAEGTWNALTGQIEDIDAAKAKQIAEADFPVAGLGFGDEGVTFNGRPLDNASGSEQFKISVRMAMAASPGLRTLFIDNGECLDAENLEVIREMAEAEDYGVLMMRVGVDESCSFVIEGGMVSPVPQTVEQLTPEN